MSECDDCYGCWGYANCHCTCHDAQREAEARSATSSPTESCVTFHDPLCPFPMWEEPCPTCEDYAQVRADERQLVRGQIDRMIAGGSMLSFADILAMLDKGERNV